MPHQQTKDLKPRGLAERSQARERSFAIANLAATARRHMGDDGYAFFLHRKPLTRGANPGMAARPRFHESGSLDTLR